MNQKDALAVSKPNGIYCNLKNSSFYHYRLHVFLLIYKCVSNNNKIVYKKIASCFCNNKYLMDAFDSNSNHMSMHCLKDTFHDRLAIVKGPHHVPVL